MKPLVHDRHNYPVDRFVVKKFVIGKVPEMEISRADYLSIKRSWKTILLIRKLETILDFLVRSYEEFEHECLTIALKSSINFHIDWQELMDDAQKVDRRIFNVLAAAKAYVDKGRSLANRIGGRVLLGSFDQSRNCQYDSHFAYKLLEYLRNHSQHAGVTTDYLSRQSHIEDMSQFEDESKRRMVYLSRPKISISSLTESGDLKSAIRKEIYNYADSSMNVDLLPHIRQYMACIGIIHEEMRQMTLPKAEAAWLTIQAFIDQYVARHDENIVGLSAVALSGSFIASDYIPLYKGSIDRIRLLCQRNASISKINQRIISSESPPHVRSR